MVPLSGSVYNEQSMSKAKHREGEANPKSTQRVGYGKTHRNPYPWYSLEFAWSDCSEESFALSSEHFRHQNSIRQMLVMPVAGKRRLAVEIGDELPGSAAGIFAGPPNREEKESEKTLRPKHRCTAC